MNTMIHPKMIENTERSKAEKQARKAKLAEIIKNNPNLLNRELAEMVGVKTGTLRLYKTELRKEGLID